MNIFGHVIGENLTQFFCFYWINLYVLKTVVCCFILIVQCNIAVGCVSLPVLPLCMLVRVSWIDVLPALIQYLLLNFTWFQCYSDRRFALISWIFIVFTDWLLNVLFFGTGHNIFQDLCDLFYATNSNRMYGNFQHCKTRVKALVQFTIGAVRCDVQRARPTKKKTTTQTHTHTENVKNVFIMIIFY